MITIPKPCHENWNDMTPKERGRLCDKCCKVVVDFTKKTTSEIVDFLTADSSAKVCGRFKTEQIAIPAAVTVQPALSLSKGRMNRRNIFVAALLLVFGSMLFTSCRSTRPEPEVMGKVSADYAQLISTATNDTIPAGNIAKTQHHKHHHPKPEPVHMMGDVAYVPDTTK